MSDNIPANAASYDNNQTIGDHKTASLKPPEQPLKCPRCDSPNTKFCYYNNYSLTQPRHFCKTCRRYWTKGGALRNVPIGGGCRKNNKTESASRLSGESSSDTGGGLNFFHGLAPAFEFQLIHNRFASFGDISSTATTTTTTAVAETSGSLFGFNYPVASVLRQGGNGGFNGETQILGSMNNHLNSTLASSINSLSSMNHDLHWKLQQQRLAMLIDGENQKESCSVSLVPATTLLENQAQKVQPISFQNLKIPNQEVCAVTDNNPRKSGNAATELFFGNSYNPTNNSSSSNAKDNTSNWSGIQAWPDLHQYSALP